MRNGLTHEPRTVWPVGGQNTDFAGLLLVTFRPEFDRLDRTALRNRPHRQSAGKREISAMIDGLVGNQGLPADVRQDIIERTDGIPLFVEEMTKALLEAGAESAARLTAAAVPSAALAVPASLHASLMARLDRLGPAKEVAQSAQRLGASFPMLCLWRW